MEVPEVQPFTDGLNVNKKLIDETRYLALRLIGVWVRDVSIASVNRLEDDNV